MSAAPRLRIVHLISGLGVGGAERALARIATQMDRHRYESIVISMLPRGPIADHLIAAGIEVHCLNMPAGRPSLRGLVRAARLLRTLRPHVLQTWLYHADLLGALLWRMAGARALVWNVRASDVEPWQLRRASRVTLRLCTRLSSMPHAVVVNSEAGKVHHIGLGYRPRRWCVIPNGIDPDEFAPQPQARLDVRRELGTSADTVLIGLVARFDPLKDHETFLRAATLLARRVDRDVRFVLVGEGIHRSQPQFAALLEQEAPDVPVIALGRRTDIARLVSALDLSTCSSVTEGFPNVVIESMACGVPCVVTDVGDAAAIVADTGRIVPARDPEALCRAWKELIAAGPDARTALGRAARARVLACYTLDSAVRSYEALYERLRSA